MDAQQKGAPYMENYEPESTPAYRLLAHVSELGEVATAGIIESVLKDILVPAVA